MPRTVLEYRFLLISPSDVAEEREAIVGVVTDWNAQIGTALGARVEVVKWESHAVPDLSGPPQQKINEQLLGDCDFAVGVFWHRLGTPTNDYGSGSEEEVERMREAGKRVLVYFSEKPIPQDRLDMDQLQRLNDLKARYRKEGLLGTFTDTANLREQVQLHLTSVVTGLMTQDRPNTSRFEQTAPATLPSPDVKVKISGGFVHHPMSGMQDLLVVDVQNHSPMTIYLGNVRLRLTNGRQFFAARDAATGEYQKRRELRPGESFSFRYSPAEILSEVRPEEVISAAVSDDIDRLYESEHGVIADMLRKMSE